MPHRQQKIEFDKRCREAYAMLRLVRMGLLDHASPYIYQWFEKVKGLEND